MYYVLRYAGGKDFAVAAYTASQLLGFQVKQYEQGHSPTNYALWAAQDLPYVVKYRKVRRLAFKWFC
jgi:hypothetical protein